MRKELLSILPLVRQVEVAYKLRDHGGSPDEQEHYDAFVRYMSEHLTEDEVIVVVKMLTLRMNLSFVVISGWADTRKASEAWAAFHPVYREPLRLAISDDRSDEVEALYAELEKL